MEIGYAAWEFISAIYEAGWDKLPTRENNRSLRQMVASHFNRKSQNSSFPTSPSNHNKVSKIPPPIPPRPSAATLAKSRHNQGTKTFAQATKNGTANILKLREAFPSLPSKKVIEIHDAAFNNNSHSRPRISMTTKGPSRKHVLIPMNEDNKNIILYQADVHVGIMNSHFKTCKSDTTIDCIRAVWNGITVTTNKVAAPSDLSIMERYFKGLEDINADDNLTPRLSQSKSYLKILGIPFYGNNSSAPITNTQVEGVLSRLSMFDNITLASRPRVVRVSPKSDMAVVWIDIWDSQSGTKAKTLVNRSFNFGRHIAIFRGTNMNPGVPQCKNCWKWGHTTYTCRAHGARCQQCSGPHKLEHH